MKRPDFTSDQENWICEIIGDWYLSWKTRIAKGEHRLGWAKEELKMLLFEIPDADIHLNAILRGEVTPEEYFLYYNKFRCSVCGEGRPNDYINVVQHDLSIESGFDEARTFVRNIRYCNDNPECIAKAHDKTNWTITTKGLPNEKD